MLVIVCLDRFGIQIIFNMAILMTKYFLHAWPFYKRMLSSLVLYYGFHIQTMSMTTKMIIVFVLYVCIRIHFNSFTINANVGWILILSSSKNLDQMTTYLPKRNTSLSLMLLLQMDWECNMDAGHSYLIFMTLSRNPSRLVFKNCVKITLVSIGELYYQYFNWIA